MRTDLATLAAGAAIGVFAANVARAQPEGQVSAHDYKPQPLNLRKDQLGTAAYVSAARGRVRAGDCLGALASFDEALRTSNQDATLYRDRGLCHEKLGHPYPAIDDYRIYLTSVPDAKDAQRIRGRLERLEDETTGRVPVAKPNDDTDVPPVSADATVSIGPEDGGPLARDKAANIDVEDDPLRVPLRRGKGFSLAPIFSVHKWFFRGASFGASETWSESIGAQLRYSAGAYVALVAEAGYEHFNSSTSDSPYTVAGLTSVVAVEFRVPLKANYDDQMLFAPGLGYEHISFSPTNPEFPSTSVNALVPRARVGFRHLFDDAAAFDVSLDAGVASWFVPSDQGSLTLPATVLVAANVGLVWAL